jgi:hypothetical protein
MGERVRRYTGTWPNNRSLVIEGCRTKLTAPFDLDLRQGTYYVIGLY